MSARNRGVATDGGSFTRSRDAEHAVGERASVLQQVPQRRGLR